MRDPEFQYELVRVPVTEAVQRCLALRVEGQGAFTPLILDSPENHFLEPPAFEELQNDLPSILAAAQELSVHDFLANRREGDTSLYDELEKGEWPAQPFRFEPYLAQQAEEAFIVKVPASRSFEALAYIGFGGWNDCPSDEEHVAVLRHWHERYGADLIGIGGDIIECTVANPPATREQALQLAREHLVYAPGSFSEFSGRASTVPEIAASLLESRHWVFWWD